ncbi:hypothetical protein AAC387_Pa03g2754 [Persea americana]
MVYYRCMSLSLRVPSNIKSRLNLPSFGTIIRLQQIEKDASKVGWGISVVLSSPLLIGVLWKESGEPELGTTVYSHGFLNGALCLLEMIHLHIEVAVLNYKATSRRHLKVQTNLLGEKDSKFGKLHVW